MKKNKHDLKGDIGYWLNGLRMHVHQAFEARLEAFHVTVAQWCILLSVYNEEATSITQLAEYIEVDKASISRVVDRLVEKSLVEHREGGDKRSGIVRLTAKGTKLIPQLIDAAEENEREFFGALTKRESAQFQQIMSKIFQKMQA